MKGSGIPEASRKFQDNLGKHLGIRKTSKNPRESQKPVGTLGDLRNQCESKKTVRRTKKRT